MRNADRKCCYLTYTDYSAVRNGGTAAYSHTISALKRNVPLHQRITEGIKRIFAEVKLHRRKTKCIIIAGRSVGRFAQ